MNKLRVLTGIILVLATVLAAGAYTKKKHDNEVYKPKAHTVIYGEWKTNKEGQKELYGLRERKVEADGTWAEWTVNRQSGRSGPGERSSVAISYQSARFFRSRQNLVREETMVGLPCFTLDVGEGAEMTYSPEYGMTPLKLTTKGGTILEALKIY